MASAVLVGVALCATGATVGVLTGGPLVRRGLRQLIIGAGAPVSSPTAARLAVHADAGHGHLLEQMR